MNLMNDFQFDSLIEDEYAAKAVIGTILATTFN